MKSKLSYIFLSWLVATLQLWVLKSLMLRTYVIYWRVNQKLGILTSEIHGKYDTGTQFYGLSVVL